MSEEFEEVRVTPGVGERIRAAREAAGMTLAQVSNETRIAQRHLEMIEANDFSSLPARTYAVGFARSVAKVVGLDPAEIATEVRAQLNASGVEAPKRLSSYEPADPARVPSAKLGWLVGLAAVVLLVAAFVFLRGFLSPSVTLPELTNETQRPAAAQAAKPAAAATTPVAQGGAVVFTALEPAIWVKFYDNAGKQLLQKEMAKGETYTIPADAQGPMIWTGRPDAFAITVGGRAVAPLADRQKVIKNIAVTAQALVARGQATPVAGAAAPGAAAAAAANVSPGVAPQR